MIMCLHVHTPTLPEQNQVAGVCENLWTMTWRVYSSSLSFIHFICTNWWIFSPLLHHIFYFMCLFDFTYFYLTFLLNRSICCWTLKRNPSRRLWPCPDSSHDEPPREQHRSPLLPGTPPCLWTDAWLWPTVIVALVDPWQRDCQMLLAPPESGCRGGLQRVLPGPLAGQTALHRSCSRTTRWLSPFLPSGSCKPEICTIALMHRLWLPVVYVYWRINLSPVHSWKRCAR